jgi:ubiquinone/menaquinone biosynthesis C-methylase UbiE
MLMHLDDPEQALAEMVRVVRPSGSWYSTSIGIPCLSTVRTRS